MEAEAALEMEREFAEVTARRRETALQRAGSKQLWHAHHHPHRYERCIAIKGRHVCRRCSWMYGCALVSALSFVLVGALWPKSWEPWILYALAIPATIEFVLGEVTRLKYSGVRQILVSIPLGLAIGRGIQGALESEPWMFWGPSLVFGPIWLIAALIGARGSGQYAAPR